MVLGTNYAVQLISSIIEHKCKSDIIINMVFYGTILFRILLYRTLIIGQSIYEKNRKTLKKLQQKVF